MKTVKSIKMVLTIAIGLGVAMAVTSGSSIAGDPKIAGPVMAPLPSKTIPNIKLQKKKAPGIKQVEKTGVAKPALKPPVRGVNRKLLSPVRPGTTQSIKQGSGLSKSAREGLSRRTVTPGPIRGPQVPVPSLTARCPDPAVVRIVPGWPTRNADDTYNFRLFAVIRNVGQGTYRSQRNQQQITLQQGNRVLKVSTWSRAVVPPGARGEVASDFFEVRNWNPNGEFSANFSAHITYDADIRIDGNSENDDCRSSNNRKVLTVVELRRTLSEIR